MSFTNLADTIPWIATLVCVLFSAQIALVFLRGSPRLFTAMALFAFSWTLLLPYWAETDPSARSELIPVYTGFLEIYMASLLALHAAAGQERAEDIVPWQTLGLHLLLFVVTPSSLLLPFLGQRQIYLVVGTTLTFAAWIFVALGVKKLAGQRAFFFISVILFVYMVIGIADTVQYWSDPTEATPVYPFLPSPAVYPFLFAVIKCVYTFTLGSIIAYHGMPSDDQSAGLRHWVLLFFKIRGPKTRAGSI